MGDFGDASVKGRRWASPPPAAPFFLLAEDKMLKCEQPPWVGR